MGRCILHPPLWCRYKRLGCTESRVWQARRGHDCRVPSTTCPVRPCHRSQHFPIPFDQYGPIMAATRDCVPVHAPTIRLLSFRLLSSGCTLKRMQSVITPYSSNCTTRGLFSECHADLKKCRVTVPVHSCPYRWLLNRGPESLYKLKNFKKSEIACLPCC